MECYLKCNITQNGSSPKMECQIKLNVTNNGMSLKLMSLKIEYYLKWNVIVMECQ